MSTKQRPIKTAPPPPPPKDKGCGGCQRPLTK